ncbi:SGNH/GDSL hydrolase family protein [Gordonia alkanivorans]|uniref:SGNH/GDSL hydrolase family protein n=1 Tax=Gordonia alkanivorans TaxID=84096 RepID=UPI002446FF87|nr:SGNH/GDSL hydrolase family protein [Gordonia alkanivorans]MDH3052006.1 SGNH/GDSL hydrolase family protein [Gordonia alkanivorans]
MGSRSRRKTPLWRRSWGGAPMWGWAIIVAGTIGCVAMLVSYATRPVPTVEAAPLTPPKEATSLTIAFLGDSYTAGTERIPKADLYPAQTLTEELACATASLHGEGGTGYTNPGDGRGVFATRVTDVVADKPHVVIVQGSINDGDPAATRRAAGSLLTQLRSELPQATIVALGPIDTPRLGAGGVQPVSAAIESAARSVGVTFISPIGWLSPQDYLADRTHPTPQGHAILGAQLRTQLARLGVDCD